MEIRTFCLWLPGCLELTFQETKHGDMLCSEWSDYHLAVLPFFLKVCMVKVVFKVFFFSVLFPKCISRVRTVNEMFILMSYVLRQPFSVLGYLYSAVVDG